MKNKQLILSAFFIFASITIAFNQENKIWTLVECVDYAYENNIQIKQQVLNTQFNENTVKQSKIQIAPNLNANTSYMYATGRVLDQSTYLYKNQDQNSQNIGISSGMTLFNGLQQSNTIKKNKYALMASIEDVERLKNDIAVNIALAYLQILLNKELLQVAESQLEVSNLQVKRTKSFVDVGNLPEGNLLEIKAQVSREEMQVIEASNRLNISYLNLTQLLDLDSVGKFEIETPDLADLLDTNYIVPPVEIIYSDAQNFRPEIRGAKFRLESSEMSLKVAKGAHSPRLTMSGNYNTLFSDTRRKLSLDPGGGIIESDYPYWDQILDNRNWGIGLGLSIPIFNGWMVNTNVNNAKLNIENYQLELKNTKNILYKEIQQAYADATAAMKKYKASQNAVISMNEAFRYTEQKYNVGMVNSVDYNTSKNTLTQAQSELLQSKYTYIFLINVLEFYRGNPILL